MFTFIVNNLHSGLSKRATQLRINWQNLQGELLHSITDIIIEDDHIDCLCSPDLVKRQHTIDDFIVTATYMYKVDEERFISY